MSRLPCSIASCVLVVTLMAPALAQQPPVTASWTVETTPIDYKELQVGDVLFFSSVDGSPAKFKLNVGGDEMHELEAPQYAAGAMCRVYARNKDVFKSEEAARKKFLSALNTTKCRDSTSRDFFFYATAMLSGHEHNGQVGAPHEHVVALFRVCLKGGQDKCAKTHFAVLFFDANTSFPLNSDAKFLYHNGLIHGPH
jgi:hypothetical protein